MTLKLRRLTWWRKKSGRLSPRLSPNLRHGRSATRKEGGTSSTIRTPRQRPVRPSQSSSQRRRRLSPIWRLAQKRKLWKLLMFLLLLKKPQSWKKIAMKMRLNRRGRRGVGDEKRSLEVRTLREVIWRVGDEKRSLEVRTLRE